MTTEEMLGGRDTFEEGGIIYSASVGRLVVDREDMKVEVESGVSVNRFLMGGDKILCRVTGVFGDRAELGVVCKLGSPREIVTPLSCEIRLSDASGKYIPLMEEAVRKGDIIIGDVIRGHPSVLISLVSGIGGIVYSSCKDCGGPLNIVDKGKIGCDECGDSRYGNISDLYGSGELYDLLPW
ncbi:MAG: exosome complex RNA-binding protein Csl4 [Thermoplasmatota archaeon]